MTKSELINMLAAENPELYHRDIERIVNTIFETISVSLEHGIVSNCEALVLFLFANMVQEKEETPALVSL